MLTPESLISDPPNLHGVSEQGSPHAWGLNREALQALSQTVQPGWRTLETGAGVSTVLFAIKQTHHTCVVPSSEEPERIRSFCVANEVPTDRLEFVQENSELALPRLAPDPLDLVLIDGSHSFPSVFIDWYYTARRLKMGGWLFVDDIHLWTGRVLCDFLRAEEDWDLAADIPPWTAAFRKRSDASDVRNWIYQPYVVSHSLLTPWQRRRQLLLDRDWEAMRRKLRRRLTGSLGGL